ncbi:hypothetical protein [Nocardia sp. NBC_00565]|uniref:hypothetical protein n=1 Tax=Nocardia sp. NBC_00565 TaxID=2975993 RepID=UPI002E7FD475|nr:hypothetical protein [Nocardia sp. NBC_00565]
MWWPTSPMCCCNVSAPDLDPRIPVVLCDARDRASCKTVLMTLLEHLIEQSVSRTAR